MKDRAIVLLDQMNYLWDKGWTHTLFGWEHDKYYPTYTFSLVDAVRKQEELDGRERS